MEDKKGLYREQFEHDNCGIGAVINCHGIKSRRIVDSALKIVENLEHRAGKDADGETGDGVGILTQIPHSFIAKVCKESGIAIGQEGEYGIAQIFFPQDEKSRQQDMDLFGQVLKEEGLKLLGYRNIPVFPGILGKKALESMPYMVQAFIEKPKQLPKGIEFDRRLYIARRVYERMHTGSYVVSMSGRTICYKGLLRVDQLRAFYADLQDEDFTSAVALVHSRFSTNTDPGWRRAHPNRLLVHNGEINTIRGNVDKMSAREAAMVSGLLNGELPKVLPVIDREGSDSSMLDNTLEFLTMSGMKLPLAAMITIPEPWAWNHTLSQEERDFYQYYATMMEPWDGPASICFTDGELAGAVLDRNGLRPSRYYVLKNGDLVLASEAGALEVADDEIVARDSLGPGKMLLVDLVRGKLFTDQEIKKEYIQEQPYGEWLDAGLLELKDVKIPNMRVPQYDRSVGKRLMRAFGYTQEEFGETIRYMALNGGEPVVSMGSDTPLAVLSHFPMPLFDYFKQLFAQVTNPPLDAEREQIVTSTAVYVGKKGNLLTLGPENCRVLKINNPILTNTDMMKIKEMKVEGFHTEMISLLYPLGESLEEAVEGLFPLVDEACRKGANIIVLSDRGVEQGSLAVPSLLAVSAVHRHLVGTRRATEVSLILESGEPREVHHFAALLGFGACAVNPYLAMEAIRELIEQGLLDKDYYAAVDDYNASVLKGIVKIASKMGISTIQSYQGAGIFEAVGVSQEVIDRFFPGTVSRIGGITLEDIERQLYSLHRAAFQDTGSEPLLPALGRHKRTVNGEEHLYNPQTIRRLQKSVQTGDYSLFREYTDLIDQERSGFLRSLMDFAYPDQGIPLEEVESVESIVTRFRTGAMSYGSLSQEAHETLALAMNHLHAYSNCGEGGESEERLDTAGSSRDKCSAIKQVASGRFGVTARYLLSAREIQIKMAQGAKPGEGGHLPGKKVYPWIAQTRHSTPGVSLISPPPHHDIYSIEDLAQLIYDLKNVNKEAEISVKLVSEAGVGTVAAGVAKAGAQIILISGSDGGTGAAPESSIHNVGLPWELGLAEAHQTLMKNGLRGLVRLETDGKLMSGRDVAIAALLGADKFGFATALLVAMGCVMMRVCNLDTCPVGIATQDPELRKRFRGKPEYVENFMRFIAMQLREYMARLGLRTVEEMVGRSDLLKKKEHLSNPVAEHIDLTPILENPYRDSSLPYQPQQTDHFHLEETLDVRVLLKQLGGAVERGEKASLQVAVKNTDRTFGTMLGSWIVRCHKNGLLEDTITINCTGTGGQSFGAFIPAGLTIKLTGDTNDYLGKGLSGGKISVSLPQGARCSGGNVIAGNVSLYGATGGKVFIAGRAGERFAVRNSGACAVVEGVGEHGCEYMTGGRVVVLGGTGKNFAAGMSGGIAYVLDENNHLYRNLNKGMVAMETVQNAQDVKELKTLIQEHVRMTGSERGSRILGEFESYIKKFKKIIPHEYKKMITVGPGGKE